MTENTRVSGKGRVGRAAFNQSKMKEETAVNATTIKNIACLGQRKGLVFEKWGAPPLEVIGRPRYAYLCRNA